MQASRQPVRILLIGTVHFANPGLDQFNVTVDDVLAEKRQLEIIEIVDRLVAFAPTTVAVEAMPSGKRVARYAQYVAGRHSLDRSEVEQIGFRVARRMRLESVSGIGAEAVFYVPEIEPLISEDGPHAGMWAELQRSGREAVTDIETWLRHRTIGEVLYRLNTQAELDRVAAPYSLLARIHSGGNDSGPRMVANWHAWNVRIVKHLMRISRPGDRVLVLFGHGHVPLLRQLLVEDPDVVLVDPLRYLPPAP
jgi:hypothetical protein